LRQAREVGAFEEDKNPSFPLEELPLRLGSWQGEDVTLNPQIARQAGSSDAIFRRYVDQATGVAVELIVLHGPARALFLHIPEICYPDAGYTQSGGPELRVVTSGEVKAPFRSLIFTKGEGSAADHAEVCYSWRYQGRWSSQPGTIGEFDEMPGIYKVQLARSVMEQERRDVGNPCESFLKVLIPEIERRLAPAS
jgi:hypothetical protein